ncbi:MAG: hypothetical protein H3C41_07230 [Bacteroidales bacterium]|nr:hypothetical protein [Bacteroidales bacterium]
MEDLIYVLLAIIWLLFSVANAKKKKQQAAPTKLPKNPLDDLLDEFLPKAPTAHSTEIESQNIDTLSDEESFTETLETTQPLGDYDIFSGEWKTDTPLEEDANNLSPQLSFLPDQDTETTLNIVEEPHRRLPFLSRFNLREAIVYQTILQRPDL